MARCPLGPVLLGTVAWCAGCASLSGAPTNTVDAATAAEASLPDAAIVVDAGSAAAPILLAKGDNLGLDGVTSDGLAIYTDGVGNGTALKAIPIAGGAPKVIVNLGAAPNYTAVSGKSALIWTNLSSAGVGTLSAWTTAGSLVQLSNSSRTLAAVSKDGSSVIYVNNADAGGLVGDLYIAGIDGSNPTPLLTTTVLQGSCAAVFFFAGNDVVVDYCAPVGDAGGTSRILSSFAGPTWTQNDLVVGTLAASVGSTAAAVVTDTGIAEVISLPSGPATVIDSSVGSGTIVLTADDSAVFYSTSTGALKHSPVANPDPTTLVGSGVAELLAYSSDLDWVVYTPMPPTSSPKTDLYLASTTTAGSPVTLSSATTASLPCYGCIAADFTTDSSRALFYADTSFFPSGDYIGTLTAMPTSGGAPRSLGQNVWYELPAKGATVVFLDNFTPDSTEGTGIADLRVVDLAASIAPRLIMASVDLAFLVTTTLDAVVFTFSQSAGEMTNAGPDTNGLYVAPIP